MAIYKREALIIAGVEVAAGLLETLVIPNLGRKKGENFFIPAKANIITSALVLTTTGVAAGFVADGIITQMKLSEDQRAKRVLIITATAIAFNVFEALFIDNIIHHRAKIQNWEIPTFKKFASNLSLLAITGLGVGFFSDQLIAATAPALPQMAGAGNVLTDKSVASVPKGMTMAE